MYLVDSSVLIDHLRAGRDPVTEFRAFFEQGRLCTCGIVVCEVLRGIVKRLVYERMEEFFSLVETVPLDDLLIRETCGLGWRLDRQGIVLPLADLLIAGAAMRAKATVVTTDPHFVSIPGLSVRASILS